MVRGLEQLPHEEGLFRQRLQAGKEIGGRHLIDPGRQCLHGEGKSWLFLNFSLQYQN